MAEHVVMHEMDGKTGWRLVEWVQEGVFEWSSVRRGRCGVDVEDLGCDGIFESVSTMEFGVHVLVLYDTLCSYCFLDSCSFVDVLRVFWSLAGRIPIC